MSQGMEFTRDDSERLVRIEEHVKSIPKMEERISRLESKQNWMLGIGSALSFIIALIVSIFGGHFIHRG
jgi:hypothetical protein